MKDLQRQFEHNVCLFLWTFFKRKGGRERENYTTAVESRTKRAAVVAGSVMLRKCQLRENGCALQQWQQVPAPKRERERERAHWAFCLKGAHQSPIGGREHFFDFSAEHTSEHN